MYMSIKKYLSHVPMYQTSKFTVGFILETKIALKTFNDDFILHSTFN